MGNVKNDVWKMPVIHRELPKAPPPPPPAPKPEAPRDEAHAQLAEQARQLRSLLTPAETMEKPQAHGGLAVAEQPVVKSVNFRLPDGKVIEAKKINWRASDAERHAAIDQMRSEKLSGRSLGGEQYFMSDIDWMRMQAAADSVVGPNHVMVGI